MLKKKNLIDQVIDLILKKIKDGELKPGEKLNSQDELAAEFGISRSTIREAFSKLVSMGILEVNHGYGTFVRTVQDYTYMDNITASYAPLEKEEIIDVLEVRKCIELQNIRTTVDKANGEDLDKLENIARELVDLIEEPVNYNKLDKMFHKELARISGNPVTSRVLGIVLNSFHEEFSSSVSVPGSLDISMQTIQKMVENLRNKDKISAVSNMGKHMDVIIEKTKEDLEL